MTPKRRQRVEENYRNEEGEVYCYVCGTTKGPFDIDHVIRLADAELYPDLDLEADANLAPICIPDHKEKSGNELKTAAKYKRIADAHADHLRRLAGKPPLKKRKYQWASRKLPTKKDRERYEN